MFPPCYPYAVGLKSTGAREYIDARALDGSPRAERTTVYRSVDRIPSALRRVATAPGACTSYHGARHFAGGARLAFVVRHVAPDGRAAGYWAYIAYLPPEARQIWAAAARAIVEPGNIMGVPLRLHVVGDAAGGVGALVLGRSAGGWIARGGGAVWSYTHRWEEIRRGAWGPISVLASCETVEGALRAARAGYAVAMVTDIGIGALRGATERSGAFRRGSAFECPQQTGGRADCASCMACARMGAGTVLALRPHGPSGRPTRAMRAKLDQYREEVAGGALRGPWRV